MATLSLTDRCDRCGAQAYLRAELMTGELFFCAHHAREYRDGLLATAVLLVDETATVGHG